MTQEKGIDMTSTASTDKGMDAAPAASIDRRRLSRAAGWGGVAAFAAWLVQPVLVIVFSPLTDELGPDFAYVQSTPFNGAIEATLFSGIGIGILFLVLGVGGLVNPRSTAARVGHALGLVSALGWFLAGAGGLAMYTSVGWSLGEVATDQRLQQALYQTLGIVATGSLLLMGIGMTGWLVMLATAGRRAGVVGLPLSVVALLAAAVLVVTMWIPFAPPWGLFAAEAMFLVLGIAFLVKARRSR